MTREGAPVVFVITLLTLQSPKIPLPWPDLCCSRGWEQAGHGCRSKWDVKHRHRRRDLHSHPADSRSLCRCKETRRCGHDGETRLPVQIPLWLAAIRLREVFYV